MPTDAPDHDVLEISIFGPGKGESILAHVGDGRWVIVDSCIDPLDKQNPAFSYLLRIGVNVSDQVDLIIATHAHDDHFAGIADLYRECERAKLVLTSAATSEEFYSLVRSDESLSFDLRQSAFSEYRKLHSIARDRRDRPASMGGLPLRYAYSGRELYSWKFGAHESSVRSYSPSDAATSRALELLAAEAVKTNEPRRLHVIDPNEMSIVVKVQAGSVSALLGADLTIGTYGLGWTAILEDFGDDLPSSLFKVPHHGSVNAHHDGVWNQMLTESPVALLAPYRAGRKPLPSAEDRSRLLSITDRTYCSASPDHVARSRAVRKVAAEISTIASNVRDPWGKSGHVRARTSLNSPQWEVELYWPALDLSAV